MTEEAADIPWGAKMAALNERQRNFVLALFSQECPEDSPGIWAAERAGYGRPDGTSTNRTLSVIACRLLQNEDVKRAIVEVGSSEYFAILPRKVRAVKHILGDKRHRDFARVAMAGIDRIVPVATTHHLTIEDHRPAPPQAIERVLARIEELGRRAGLLPSPQIVDAEYTVVEGAHD